MRFDHQGPQRQPPHWPQELRAKGTHVQLFTSTAFGIGVKNVTFYVDKNNTAGAWVSTLDGTMPEVTQTTYKSGRTVWNLNPFKSIAKSLVRTEVQSEDAAAFLARLHLSSSFVALKMDVEGFEYTLLPHLLQTNPSVLCQLQVLAIEWHKQNPRHMKATRRELRSRLRGCNITVLDWH